MTTTVELRELCAQRLLAAAERSAQLTAFVGLDGFVDEILHVVDKRMDAQNYERVPTIAVLADRISEASGKSTNIELVNQLTKLGGNGPIMANALASFGLIVTYLGNLGYPRLHPVFDEFAKRAEVHSIAEPGHTDALEFEDGKIMLGKHSSLKDVNWPNIEARFGRDRFVEKFGSADLVAFVNWTMLPHMSDIWEALQTELCPGLKEPRRSIFFDLCDPEKRTAGDITHALELIVRFEEHFNVILGLNEKEANEIAEVLGLNRKAHNAEALSALARELRAKLPVGTIVIHPVSYALALSGDAVDVVKGPHVSKPKITTGAGDHFNAGFCLGKLLGFDNAMCVLTGVTTSGYYVRTATSPSVSQLAELLRKWPGK
jgi:sugar/nucleoside kinase (ribokinase family)